MCTGLCAIRLGRSAHGLLWEQSVTALHDLNGSSKNSRPFTERTRDTPPGICRHLRWITGLLPNPGIKASLIRMTPASVSLGRCSERSARSSSGLLAGPGSLLENSPESWSGGRRNLRQTQRQKRPCQWQARGRQTPELPSDPASSPEYPSGPEHH